MIKRKLLWFLAVLTLWFWLSFSSASWLWIWVVGQSWENSNNNTFDNSVLRYGSVLTSLLGVSRDMFSIYYTDDYSNFFYWSNDWLMSMYSSDWDYTWPKGGSLKYFYLCDYVSDYQNFSSFSNCSQYNYDWLNIDILNNALLSVSAWDTVFYWDALSCSNCDLRWSFPFLGINSSSYWKVILFFAKTSAWGIEYWIPWDYYSTDYVNVITTDSYDFATFPSSFVWVSPAAPISNTNVSAWQGQYVPVSWNVVSTTNKCTQKKALDWYRSQWLTDSICYSYFQTMTWLAWYEPWLTYADIWFDTMDLRRNWDSRSNMTESEWFKFWRAWYKSYKYWQHSYNDIFSNIPNALPWYFSRLYINWDYVDSDWILEYCQYAVYTPSQINTTLYDWVNFSSVCRVSWWGLNNQTPWISYGSWGSWGSGSWGSSWWGSITPWGWAWWWWGSSRGDDWDDNIVSIDWWGFIGDDSTESWEVLDLQSWKSFISNFYNTVKENLQKPNKNDFWLGILPDYIIFALLWLIFFRFLSH